jgi:hypothetical protein
VYLVAIAARGADGLSLALEQASNALWRQYAILVSVITDITSSNVVAAAAEVEMNIETTDKVVKAVTACVGALRKCVAMA